MWENVYAWLLAEVATFSGLSTGTVFDGLPVTQDQLLTFAAVGDGDPAGTYEQDVDSIDTLISETGEIAVKFVSRSGDDDLAPHRTVTKAWVDALRDAIKVDQTLGGLLMQGSTAVLTHIDIRQQKTDGGVYVERAVTFRYFTRL